MLTLTRNYSQLSVMTRHKPCFHLVPLMPSGQKTSRALRFGAAYEKILTKEQIITYLAAVYRNFSLEAHMVTVSTLWSESIE